jgi:hypothetical protein
MIGCFGMIGCLARAMLLMVGLFVLLPVAHFFLIIFGLPLDALGAYYIFGGGVCLVLAFLWSAYAADPSTDDDYQRHTW